MNGQDKGLVIYKNKPLIEHLIDGFSPQVSSCIISANRNIPRYQQYGYPVYSDEIEGFSGPLAGIATALKHCDTDWLACVPCDAFSIPNNLVQQLHSQALSSKSSLCIVDDGNRWQPLYAVIHRQLLNSLEDFLSTGNKRVMQWVKLQHPAVANFSKDKELFKNINSLDDLERNI